MPTITRALRRLDPRARIRDLESQLQTVRERNAKLRARNAELKERLGRVRERNERLRQKQAGRTSAVAELPGVSRLELRRRSVLHDVAADASILEIGPAHNAILPKREGYRTKTVDYLDRDGLIERYKDFPQYSPDDIEDVDFVLPPGAAMADVIDERFDLVVASHVLEHTTSLIDFLNESTRLLTPQGVLALVVPDHRYCFDRFRERSGIARIIDASLNPPSLHTVGTVVEERLNATKHRGTTAWMPGHLGDYELVNDVATVRTWAERAAAQDSYIDTHNWIFTPHHLRLMLRDLHALGYVQRRERSYHDTVRHEFFINLSLDASGPAETREELLVLSESERISMDRPTFAPAAVRSDA